MRPRQTPERVLLELGEVTALVQKLLVEVGHRLVKAALMRSFFRKTQSLKLGLRRRHILRDRPPGHPDPAGDSPEGNDVTRRHRLPPPEAG